MPEIENYIELVKKLSKYKLNADWISGKEEFFSLFPIISKILAASDQTLDHRLGGDETNGETDEKDKDKNPSDDIPMTSIILIIIGISDVAIVMVCFLRAGKKKLFALIDKDREQIENLWEN